MMSISLPSQHHQAPITPLELVLHTSILCVALGIPSFPVLAPFSSSTLSNLLLGASSLSTPFIGHPHPFISNFPIRLPCCTESYRVAPGVWGFAVRSYSSAGRVAVQLIPLLFQVCGPSHHPRYGAYAPVYGRVGLLRSPECRLGAAVRPFSVVRAAHTWFTPCSVGHPTLAPSARSGRDHRVWRVTHFCSCAWSRRSLGSPFCTSR